MRPVPDSTPYAAAWRSYRFWSRAFWLLFVGFLPGMALVDRGVRQTYGEAANTTTMVAALAWMIAFTVAGYRRSNFPCPRCCQMFFRVWDDRPWRKDWASKPFTRRCVHCALPKWAETGDG